MKGDEQEYKVEPQKKNQTNPARPSQSPTRKTNHAHSHPRHQAQANLVPPPEHRAPRQLNKFFSIKSDELAKPDGKEGSIEEEQ